jgi:hypothetical protein
VAHRSSYEKIMSQKRIIHFNFARLYFRDGLTTTSPNIKKNRKQKNKYENETQKQKQVNTHPKYDKKVKKVNFVL